MDGGLDPTNPALEKQTPKTFHLEPSFLWESLWAVTAPAKPTQTTQRTIWRCLGDFFPQQRVRGECCQVFASGFTNQNYNP